MATTAQPPPFSCAVARDGLRTVVSPSGELDITTVDVLRAGIDRAVADGASSIVVELGDVRFIDSSGIRSLLTATARARREGFQLEVVPPAADVMRVFELTGTDAVLPFRQP